MQCLLIKTWLSVPSTSVASSRATNSQVAPSVVLQDNQVENCQNEVKLGLNLPRRSRRERNAPLLASFTWGTQDLEQC